MMSAGRIARHRNYGDLMQRHERDLKIKRITRLVIYFLIIAFLAILYLMVTRWQNREEKKIETGHPHATTATLNVQPSDTTTSYRL
jgi:hypothetical protein